MGTVWGEVAVMEVSFGGWLSQVGVSQREMVCDVRTMSTLPPRENRGEKRK